MNDGKRAGKTRTIEQVIARRRARLNDRRDARQLVLRVLFLAAVGYVLATQVFLLDQNHGQDMFPALKDGDLCIAFRTQMQTLLKQRYVRDDVVAYRHNDRRRFGRIVATEGDVVNITEAATLVVNGTPIGNEILFPTDAREAVEYPCRVPEGCVFVLGDYRPEATDSRDFGPVPLDSVEGKVITILRRRGL